MKNITKVILSSAFLFAFANTSNAQLDLSTTSLVAPTPGSTVNTLIAYPIDIRFMNNSSTTIPGGQNGAEVEIHFYANGAPISGSPVTGFRLPNAGLAGGADIGFNGLNFRFSGLSAGPTRICYVVRVAGNNDPVAANDSVCGNYTVSAGGTIDLGMTNPLSATPNVPAGGLINGNITGITATVNNYGTITYPAGYEVNFSIFIQGQNPVNAVFNLAADLPPNGSETSPTLSGAPIVVPDADGTNPVELCASIVVPNDNDNTNNSSCTSYQNATGVEEILEEADKLSSVYFNRGTSSLNINLSNKVKGNVNFTITNMSGQVYTTADVTVNGEKQVIDLTGIATGMYIVNMTTAAGQVESQKFVVN